MKKGIFTLIAALLAGILAFYLTREQVSPASHPVLLDSLPELNWLRTDLKLTDEQFSKVEKLHRDYRPECLSMCKRIAESKEAVARLANEQNGMSDDLAKAIENHGTVIAACQRSMLAHLYQTAALMDEQQARRYLDATIPLALDSIHGSTTTASHE